MQVVLFQPQIPQNAGNVVRTCSVTGCGLTLVKPLGFQVTDRALKRAGLDYWQEVNIEIVDDLKSYLHSCRQPFYFFSSKANKLYTEVKYTDSDLLVFGSETAGLDPYFKDTWPEHFYTLPMKKNSRCLNLANAVSIVIYEAWRQQGFAVR